MNKPKECACGGLERHRLLEDFLGMVLKAAHQVTVGDASPAVSNLIYTINTGHARIEAFERRKAAERLAREKTADRMVDVFSTPGAEDDSDEIWPWGWRL